MDKYIPTPKIYKNTIDEIEFLTGLTASNIGNGLFLFCHWQKPNIQNKYIAISVIDNGAQTYDLYEIPYDIEYENICDSYGIPKNGPAKLLNIEQHFNFAYHCLKVSKLLHSHDSIFPNIKKT